MPRLALALLATTLVGPLAVDVMPVVTAVQNQSVQESELESYIGAYALESGLTARITLRGKELVAEIGAAPPAPLKATANRVFEATSAEPYRVTFNAERSELQMTSPTSRQVGRRIIAPTAILERYTGRYPLSDTLAMVLHLEGERLIAQATGASRHPLFPESSTLFFVQDSASSDVAHLEFGADPDGKAFVVFRQMGAAQKVYRK